MNALYKCSISVKKSTWNLIVFSLLSETQDDLEAITNDIKKMANNARNKLKSECSYLYDMLGRFGLIIILKKHYTQNKGLLLKNC